MKGKSQAHISRTSPAAHAIYLDNLPAHIEQKGHDCDPCFFNIKRATTI
jgi:hypothetical protein